MLRLSFFGGLRASVNERIAIDTHTPRLKAKALLAYLYLERGRYVTKDELVEALWPEAEHVGPSRLKQTVLTLRRLIEPGMTPHYVLQRGGTYYFNTLARSWSDVEEFEREVLLGGALRQQQMTTVALAHFRRALTRSQAPFLPELQYEGWVAARSAALRAQRLDALEAAAALLAEAGDPGSAIALLKQAVREDSLRESSYLELMRALQQQGRSVDAVRVYEHLRRRLAADLQATPGAELSRLADALRRQSA